MQTKEGRLRSKLAKQLGLDEIPTPVWEYLVEMDFVREALDPYLSDGFEQLVRYARRLLRLIRETEGRRAPPGRSSQQPESDDGYIPSKDITKVLNAHERERALALAEYSARLAAFDPHVSRFRTEILTDRMLNYEEVHAFLYSPALAYFTREELLGWGVDLINHSASLIEETEEHDENTAMLLDHRVRVSIQPGGLERTARKRGHVDDILGRLALPRSTGKIVSLSFWQSSVLGELLQLARWLRLRYGWSEPQAVMFVLTGDIPQMDPLSVRFEIHPYEGFRTALITITAAPWLSADTIKRAYRHAQGKVLGGDNRPLAARGLAIFRFVVARSGPLGEPSKWPMLLKEWIHERPDLKTESQTTSLFTRDFNRAARAILFPRYKKP